MTLLQQTCAAIVPADETAAAQAQARLDAKTKPRGSLGRLEELAVRLAAAYGTADPPLPAAAVLVLAADHGVAAEGVSAYPAAVTGQMVANFLAGGAAINVLARQQGVPVVVADLGILQPVPAPGLRQYRQGPGTANFTRGPAMSPEAAAGALEAGIRLADEQHAAGVRLLGVGEMGIGNSTAASGLTAVLTGRPAAEVTGRGTGVNDEGLRNKVAVIERALRINRPDPADALDVVAKLGGFEIAGLAGVLLGAAARRLPVVLDGFITGAAALVAAGLCPTVKDYLIAGHRSVEPGHVAALGHLGLRPLLELDLRLGEGTGAVLALHLAQAALRVLREMATFAAAGVTDAGA